MKCYPEQIELSEFRELTEITGNWKLETGNRKRGPISPPYSPIASFRANCRIELALALNFSLKRRLK